MLALYLDDILIEESSLELFMSVKTLLSEGFYMKDFAEARSCLGTEISRNRP